MWNRFIAGAALMTLATAVAAQQPPKPAQVPAAEHALFGTLKALDLSTNTLVVAPLAGSDVTFKVDPRALHIRDFETSPTLARLAKKTGAGLVVHFKGSGTEVMAVQLDYIGHEPMKVTTGTIVRIEKANRVIVIKTATGTEEKLQLAVNAPIELATGLVEFDAFAGTLNEQVSLYYTEGKGHKEVRLIKQAAPAAS
jgi:hypothetical protein